MSLAELPWEVLEVISSFCGQADVINLAVACPPVAEAVLPGIYRSIVIDTARRPLQIERPTRVVGGRTVPSTIVHTIAGTKQCLEALAQRPKFGAHVRSLVCNGNVAISDNVLLPLAKSALANLTNLLEFSWSACPELPPSVLAELAPQASQSSRLQTLSVDLAIRPGETYPAMSFPSLRSMHVRPFLNADVLTWIGRIAQTSDDLEDIELCRFLDSKSEVGSSYRFVGLSDVQARRESVSAVHGFFGRVERDARPKWLLRRLALAQTDTSLLDSDILLRVADLSGLHELVLTGSGYEDEANHRLLASIVKVKPQLTRLTLDWNTSHATVMSLFANCCEQLEALTIHVREFPRQTLEIIGETCASTLRELFVHIDASFTRTDLEPLARLHHIEVLKLPFAPTVNSWELAATLPLLKVIELQQSTASASTPRMPLSSSRASNLGLLTSGILDAWNDSLPSPLQYENIFAKMRGHPELRYVVIDGHTMCLRHDAPPLDHYLK